jgi:hypothetical protein
MVLLTHFFCGTIFAKAKLKPTSSNKNNDHSIALQYVYFIGFHINPNEMNGSFGK